MKKSVFLLFAVMTSSIGLSSCVKDYTCTCTGSSSSYQNSSTVFHTSKSKATKACSDLGTLSGPNYSCKIQ